MEIKALAAALVVAASASHAAADRVSSGPLGLRGPDLIVLGKDTAISVELKALVTPVRLVSNTGSISSLTRQGDALRATFTPPAERFPQLVLIAAVDDAGAIVDWIAIPMSGRAAVRVDTAPRARVVVRVQGTEFGPVEASARGIAEVPIVVPPGVTQVTTIATTASGAVREKLAPLGARAYGKTLAVCSQRGERVSVLATTAAGTASERAPQLTASSGALGIPAAVGAGVFTATFAPNSPADELATITSVIDGESLAAASCELRIAAEAPTGIEVTPDRSEFVAGSGAMKLTIALRYPGARRPLPIDQIEITAHVGTARATRSSTGAWTATWLLPDRFAARTKARAQLRVRLRGGLSVESEFVVPLVAADPAAIEIMVPGPLRANGESTAVVGARVVDRWGNLVGARPLTATSRGQMTAFVATTGDAQARYTAPHMRTASDDVIEIREPQSGIVGRATLRLVPLPRRLQLSARAGYVSNLGTISAPLVTVTAGARLPVLDEALVADVLTGGYTATIESSAMSEAVSLRLTTIPVLARVAYHAARGRFDVWGGAGAGVAIARSRVTSASAGISNATTTAPAATVFAGAARRTGPGWILIEGAYLHATIDGAIAGRVGGVVATAGFALDL